MKLRRLEHDDSSCPNIWFRSHSGFLGALAAVIMLAGVSACSRSSAVESTSNGKPATGNVCQTDRQTDAYTEQGPAGNGTYTPCLIDTGITNGESSLGITKDGTLMRSVALSPIGVAVSTDDGVTWVNRALPSGASSGVADGYLDPVTNRFFFTAIGLGPVYSSDDKGKTWMTGTVQSSNPLPVDWPKVFSGRPATPRTSGYPNNVYYCNWTIPLGVASGTQCFRSLDGGLTFQQVGPVFPQAVCTGLYTPSSGHGRGIVDSRDGTIYMPIVQCGKLDVVVSKDDGESWTRLNVPEASTGSVLSLVDELTNVAYLQQLASGGFNIAPPEFETNSLVDVIGIDATGRLYIVWCDGTNYLLHLATSTDGGKTWNKSVRLTPPELTQAIEPALHVTPEGRVGLSYYGTTDRINWTGYLTISEDATVAQPVFQTASVTRPGEPLMSSPCCSANGLQEFSASQWAPDGTFWGAFVRYNADGTDQGMMGRLIPR